MSRVATVALGLIAAAPAAQSQESAVKNVNLRTIESNGIEMRIAEMGEGPLVLLIHGWPESWYSWRHQIPALAEAGYHAVAPDMRGYGGTDAPESIEEYDIVRLTADVVGIIDALGEERAVVIGHDWGAIVAWHCALLHPDRFSAVVGMSVPYSGRARVSLIDSLKRAYGDNFFYILYYQEPGKAEAEFDADPRGILSRLYLSPDSPREAPTLTDPKMGAGGWIPRLGKPKGLPDWLTAEDLDYYVGEFQGAFAEYVKLTKRQLRRVPEGLDLRAAALAEPLAVALHGITLAGVKPGQRALVTGVGPIGALTLAALRAKGVEDITVSEPLPLRRELAAKLGASRVVEPDALDVPAMPFTVIDDARQIAFECSGNPSAFEASLAQLDKLGTLVIVGTGMKWPQLDPNRVLLNELTITGAYTYDDDGFEQALELLASGELPTDLLIEASDVSLDGIIEAMKGLVAGRLGGKVLVAPR